MVHTYIDIVHVRNDSVYARLRAVTCSMVCLIVNKHTASVHPLPCLGTDKNKHTQLSLNNMLYYVMQNREENSSEPYCIIYTELRRG